MKSGMDGMAFMALISKNFPFYLDMVSHVIEMSFFSLLLDCIYISKLPSYSILINFPSCPWWGSGGWLSLTGVLPGMLCSCMHS